MAAAASDRACFVACYADSVGHSNPCGWYMPNGPLTFDDIDALMPHFLYSTPRSVVYTKFLESVGPTRAFNFVIDVDPMLKIRTDPQWMTVLNILLQMMAAEGTLKWGILDEGDGGAPRVVFTVEEEDDVASVGGGGSDGDDDSDSAVSNLTDEVIEWWDSDC